MKKIVICCDGTWNRADQEKNNQPTPTNVLNTAFRTAKRQDGGNHQIVLYDQGVGTGNTVDRLTGGAFGRGLEENIFDAYRFLIANYQPGDDIYLFGFSRGAFTARSIAGMIRNCGILTRSHVSRYREALDLYTDAIRKPDHPDAIEFRKRYSVDEGEGIPICFLGVWDTVGSLGIPLRGLRWITGRQYQFHDVELSGSVKAAYHALAIDERRAPFAPTLWAHKPKPGQKVEEVWFAGVHTDVGGGYPERELSLITLRWMLEKAQAEGLDLDPEVEKNIPLTSSQLGDELHRGKLHNSKKGLYRVTKGIDREIGLAPVNPEEPDGEQMEDPKQSIHESVRLRWNALADYRPKPLRNYFQRLGGVPDGWDPV